MKNQERDIINIMQKSKESKKSLLNGDRKKTLDEIDSDIIAEFKKLLKQQTEECIQENKKKREKLVVPNVEEKQE